MANENLHKAKKQKIDEFYTQYSDIQKEVNAYLEYDVNVFRNKTVFLPCDDPEWSNFTKFFAQNFENFGLKKLISTSYAVESKNKLYGLLDYFKNAELITNSVKYDPKNDKYKGKIFTLERGDKKVDYDNLEWNYLNGDGDFRSKEIEKICEEADFIITNPPFSLFREFIAWLFKLNKKFLILGNINAITYKDVFFYIKTNQLWLGATNFNKGMYFFVPNNFVYAESYKFDREYDGRKVNRVPGVCWFTNVDHGRRHKPLELMTMTDNLKFNKEIKQINYPNYENYNAIEVSSVDAIPSDYDGVMGVPISFLDKYCPEQFGIVALGIVGSCDFINNRKMIVLDKQGKETEKTTWNAKGTLYRKHTEFDKKPPAFKDCITSQLYQSIYARILIRKCK